MWSQLSWLHRTRRQGLHYTSGTKRKHFAALSSPRPCWRWLQLQPSCGPPRFYIAPVVFKHQTRIALRDIPRHGFGLITYRRRYQVLGLHQSTELVCRWRGMQPALPYNEPDFRTGLPTSRHGTGYLNTWPQPTLEPLWVRAVHASNWWILMCH